MTAPRYISHPCQHCRRWSVIENSRGQLICEACLSENFDTPLQPSAQQQRTRLLNRAADLEAEAMRLREEAERMDFNGEDY